MSSLNNRNDVHVIDVRTDTITKPSKRMREVMVSAKIGDNAYGEDPSCNELEKKCAALLGKEDGVYVASGTMANLIAVMIYCDKRGSEFIAGDKSYTFLNEQGLLTGVHCTLIANQPDGTFSLEELEEKIRICSDGLEPYTRLIVVENTHTMCGGKVLPLQWLDNLAKVASKYNIPVHMDGARLMHAVVQSKVPANRITRDMDSVFICLSKDLGCPMGSVLCGSKSFVDLARRYRRLLGGQMRQIGFFAAAGLFALDEMVDRLQVDHDHTYQIAKAIDDLDSHVVRVDLASVQTNILMIHLDKNIITANEFLEKLAAVDDNDKSKVSVQGSALGKSIARIVLHCEISDADTKKAINKISMVIKKIHNELKIK